MKAQTHQRPEWEVQSLAAYCRERGISQVELAAAEDHATQNNNALYESFRGWIVGTGQPKKLAYIHEGILVYDYPYERISLIEWVERLRTEQGE